MVGLAAQDPVWDQARAQGVSGRVYEDDSLLIATDFEGGNGTDIRRVGPDRYAISCMIKQHDKFPIERSRDHAVTCLKAATQAY